MSQPLIVPRRGSSRSQRYLRIILPILVLLLPGYAAAAEDELSGGLIGRYTAQSDPADQVPTSVERVDSRIAFTWNQDAPDARLPAGPFNVQWRGYLMTQARGQYRLFIHSAGEVKITLGGQTLLEAASDEPTWHATEPLELPFDWHPIEITYRRLAQPARIALFWSGPQFPLEPIGERFWFHEPDETPDVSFQRGAEVASSLRCAACHQPRAEAPAGAHALEAPALDRLEGNLRTEWLVTRLTATADSVEASQLDHSQRMPHFAFSREDAEAVAAYLFAASLPVDSPAAIPTARPRTPEEQKPKAKPPSGEELFLSIGCLACHQHGQLGVAGLFDGGDLTRIAQKRPASFFARWLDKPETVNIDHRMPRFELPDDQRQRIAEWLAASQAVKLPADTADDSPVSSDAASSELLRSDPARLARGKQLVAESRCGSCHRLPGEAVASERLIQLTATSRWQRSCASDEATVAAPSPSQPTYKLTKSDVTALRMFWSQQVGDQRSQSPEAGRRLLVENNCVACHARGDYPGLGQSLPPVAQQHAQFERLLPAMTPPSLNSVGDKLHDAAFRTAIRQPHGHRPYLLVQMPRFRVSDDQLHQLVEHLIASDRIPDDPPASLLAVPRADADGSPTTAALPAADEPDADVLRIAGPRLVTSDGFGCTSCHRVGQVEPPPGPLAARGPSLSLMGERIRRPWFDRWVRNPARIVPQMEMPSVQLPVHGVLNDDLEMQLSAVWQVLNQPGFEPPAPNAVRVVRRSGIRERVERAVLLTDVLRVGKEAYLKPALVGLPNRHNVLFDLESGRLAGWWIGDAARQRTEGKTWHWEAGGSNLWVRDAADAKAAAPSDFTWVDASGALWVPRPNGQFITELDSWEHDGAGGLVFRHRLHLDDGFGERQAPAAIDVDSNTANPQYRVVSVRQTLTPRWIESPAASAGFRREIALEHVPPNYAARIYLGGKRAEISEDGRVAMLAGQQAVGVRLVGSTGAQLGSDQRGVFVQIAADATDPVTLEYETTLSGDLFPFEAPPIQPPPRESLNVVPGFDAVRLPIADELMPTGLAWRPNGDLIATSLKGRVWLARDTNGDGLEDRVEPFSDELAAPYGAAAGDGYIDVITKYALLRLHDKENTGFATRTETLASGWGHTADYHDWAVGMPGDGADGYYLALPCQQDNRSAAAARMRGEVVRLTPRSPTWDDPRRFDIVPVSRGHRFAMGLARNQAGDLFASDNQGNYKPFNELNHVVPGAHFGFINANERRSDVKPTVTPPVVKLPHPWTRSVNGICFLETPEATRRETGREVFGPFEGHLVGCEYDTRRLVRISLQRVGDSYQGAVYPLSYDRPPEGEPLLGPISCAVSPRGDLYIGNLRDSGWGGANNIGSLVRLRPRGETMPPGIAEVRAVADGLEVIFTCPIDPARAAESANYSLASYTRIPTPAYGGSDVERRKESIAGVRVAEDGRSVRLQLRELREGFVYELHVQRLVSDGEFFPDEAHYTLNRRVK